MSNLARILHTDGSIMNWVYHHFNSMHVFCRLRSLGLSKRRALKLALIWEKIVHPGLYHKTGLKSIRRL